MEKIQKPTIKEEHLGMFHAKSMAAYLEWQFKIESKLGVFLVCSPFMLLFISVI